MRKGRIDECRGRYVYGWAVAAEPGAHCVVRVTDATGAVVAQTVAALPRPDLAAVGGGGGAISRSRSLCRLGWRRGRCGSRPTGSRSRNRRCTWVKDVIDGSISVREGAVSGWICSRGTVPVTQPVSVINQDGVVVLTLPTSLDPTDSDPLFRPARYSAELPACCFGRPELVLLVRVGDAIVARCVAGGRLEGYLDRITGSACVGWLFSPDAPGRAFDIAVYRDGVLAGTGRTRGAAAGRGGTASGCGGVWVRLCVAGGASGAPGDDACVDPAGRLDAGAVRRAVPDRLAWPGGRVGWRHRGGAAGAMALWLRNMRAGGAEVRIAARPLAGAVTAGRRLTIVIPCYGDVAATRVCFESVLRTRLPGADAVVIVNDNPHDAKLADLVHEQGRHPDVFALRNDRNLDSSSQSQSDGVRAIRRCAAAERGIPRCSRGRSTRCIACCTRRRISAPSPRCPAMRRCSAIRIRR